MKFGRKITVRILINRFSSRANASVLQASLYDEWKPFYIDYNLLKRELKVSDLSFHSSISL